MQENKKVYKNKNQTMKKMAIGTYISIITLNLNVNALNAPTKRHRQTKIEGLKKRYSTQIETKRKQE